MLNIIRSAAVGCALLAGGTGASASAAEVSSLAGSWRLISYQVESEATREKLQAMGPHPTGRVIFTAEHRVSFVLTGDKRETSRTEAGKAALLDSLVAYTGIEYTTDNQWCTRVEAAWNPEWVGTTQCREYRVKGRRLEVLTPWREMPNWPGTTRSIITFERE